MVRQGLFWNANPLDETEILKMHAPGYRIKAVERTFVPPDRPSEKEWMKQFVRPLMLIPVYDHDLIQEIRQNYWASINGGKEKK
jgi:hypothetical protein